MKDIEKKVAPMEFTSDEIYGLLREYSSVIVLYKKANRELNKYILINSHGVIEEPYITIAEAENLIFESLMERTGNKAFKIPLSDRDDWVQDTVLAFISKKNSMYMYKYCHSDKRDNDILNRKGYLNVFYASETYNYHKKTERRDSYKDKDSNQRIKLEFISLNDDENECREALMAEVDSILEEMKQIDERESEYGDERNRHNILVEALKGVFTDVGGSADKVLLASIKLCIMALGKGNNGGISDYVDGDKKLKKGALRYVNGRTPAQIVKDFASIISEISGGKIILEKEEVDYIFSDPKFINKLNKNKNVCKFTVDKATNDAFRVNERMHKIFTEDKKKDIIENHYDGGDDGCNDDQSEESVKKK